MMFAPENAATNSAEVSPSGWAASISRTCVSVSARDIDVRGGGERSSAEGRGAEKSSERGASGERPAQEVASTEYRLDFFFTVFHSMDFRKHFPLH